MRNERVAGAHHLNGPVDAHLTRLFFPHTHESRGRQYLDHLEVTLANCRTTRSSTMADTKAKIMAIVEQLRSDSVVESENPLGELKTLVQAASAGELASILEELD